MEQLYWDINLKRVLEEAIGCEITEESLKRITKIEADNKGIYDLKGLRYCTNLTVLKLPNNRVLDLSPLESLSNLTDLDLTNNSDSKSVQNGYTEGHFWPDPADADVMRFPPEVWQRNPEWIEPRPRYKSIKVKLGDLTYSNFGPLSGLLKLRRLELAENKVSSSSLENLANLNLEYLGLKRNSIDEFQPLLKFNKLSLGCKIDLRENPFFNSANSAYYQKTKQAVENRNVVEQLRTKGIELLIF